MQTTSGYFTDRNGDRKSGQLVYVYLGASLATIYEAGTTTAKSNPFLSDATGAWSFTAPNDDYIVYKIENGVISQITDTSTTYTTDYVAVERISNGYFYRSLSPWEATSFAYDSTVTRTANTGSAKITGSTTIPADSGGTATATGDLWCIINVPDTVSAAKTLSFYGIRTYSLSGVGALLTAFSASITAYLQRLDTGDAESSAGSLSITSDSAWTLGSFDVSSAMVDGGVYGIRLSATASIHFASGVIAGATGTVNLRVDDISLRF